MKDREIKRRTYPIEFYKTGGLFGNFQKWRWRVTADNGNIIGASTQGYWNKSDCIDNVKLLGLCFKAKVFKG